MTTRVRFAPSPTGPLHIGGLRTALFNYLYAKKDNGVFILRVEDTDQNRYVPESEAYILESLRWCGISPDEGPKSGGDYGPYRQSERKAIYQKYIQELIAVGKAYLAFDSSDVLEREREKAAAQKETFQYGAHNRMQFQNSLTLDDETVTVLKKSKPYVVRLKVTPGENVQVADEIRGVISVQTENMDDKILMKADGMPTYHFANVVDDHLMKISCVIRGEEWLPSLPLHQLLYDAFGWESPKFMHLPLILKPTGKGKLSKRDGDKAGFPVFPLQWGEDTAGFREKGFLAEGLINYLALLGWNEGNDNEIFTIETLKKVFGVDGIQKGGARFDYDKARWVNHQHIQMISVERLIALSGTIGEVVIERYGRENGQTVIRLIKERLNTLTDIEKEVGFFVEDPQIDDVALKKVMKKDPERMLKGIKTILGAKDNLEGLKESCMEWAKANGLNAGGMMQSLRIAVVGKLSGPDLFESIKLLGKNVTLRRIEKTIEHITKSNF